MNLKITRRDFMKGSAAMAVLAALKQTPLAHALPVAPNPLTSEPMYLGLGTAIPEGIREVSGNGYLRSAATFEPTEDGGFKNAEPVIFSQALAQWGTIYNAALFLGNELIAVTDIYGSHPKFINNGDNVQIDNICIKVGGGLWI